MEQLLDESPIHSDHEQALDSQYGEEQSDQEEELFDSETFKGSFLQEMEKLCRPLKFERERYDIYNPVEDSSEQNILNFMEDSQEPTEQKLDLSSAPMDYIIDFQGEASPRCDCKCHINNQNRRTSPQELKAVQKEAPIVRNSKSEVVEGVLNKDEKEGWRKDPERNWTSLSLKQYKQRIKKKLQQKR